MKILITGTHGIALALATVYQDHQITCVSRETGHDIKEIKQWGTAFTNYDMVFNNAYNGFSQIDVLEFFYSAWKSLPDKKIITIGSRSSYMPGHDTKNLAYWPYQIHKQALQSAHDKMLQDSCCDLKIINPGPIDTAMVAHLDVPKMSTMELAQRIRRMVEDPALKRVDLWL